MADDSLRPISRAEAQALGLRQYFTGEPCKHGHIAPRNVGTGNRCVVCKAIGDAAYGASRKAEKAEYDRSYRQKNGDALREVKSAYREANREAINEDLRRRYHAEPERRKEYRVVNREKRNAQKREWHHRNREHVAKYALTYNDRKMAEDVNYRLRVNLRIRLAVAVRAGSKGGSAVRDLGCSIAELKDYLQARFLPGMTWENWGRKGWHIDHIKPLASFDLTEESQVRVACHFTNLQPLWWRDNLAKGSSSST